MKTAVLFATAVLALAAPRAADAQQLKLHIQGGLVTLDAQNVPVRQILAEWARVGGARVVNGEKVVGAPVTLELRDVPERQALDTVLRGVSGYMLAARVDAATGPSAYDRILILPASSAPRTAPPAPVAEFVGRPTPVPAEVEETEPIVDEDNDVPDDEDASEHVPPPDGQDMINRRFQGRPNVFPNPMGGQPQPFVPVPSQPEEEPQDAMQVTPGNPFGLPAGATTTPGVVTPVPQQEDQPPPNVPGPRRPRPPR